MSEDKGYRLIKLNNGDNIIARITKIGNAIVVLENPFLYKTMTIFSPSGLKNIVLLKKWFELTSQNIIEVPLNSICSMTIPNDKIIFLYEKEKNRIQSPYISNDELYKNPKLMDMIENSSLDKQNSSDKKPEEIEGTVNISMKITPEMLKENQGLENLLRAIGIPIDELFEQLNQQQEEEEFDSFGNDFEDWSPDPNDYLK